MYAIVEIAGQQFKVEKGQKLFVQRLHDANNAEEDAKLNSDIEFEKVLVLSHVKGDKVLVFHKKRRKGLRKLNGHRQYFTEIQINDVVA